MPSGRLALPLLLRHVAQADSGRTLATLGGHKLASLNSPDGVLAKDRAVGAAEPRRLLPCPDHRKRTSYDRNA